MVCSSNLIFNDLSKLSSNGALHIQQNKKPPTDCSRLKSIHRNPEKLSWSQTKALKMSKPESSWEFQRQSSENQRHQLFATLLDDDDEFLSTVDKDINQDVKDNEIEEIKIVDYFSLKDNSSVQNISSDNPLRNTVAVPNMMNYQPIIYNNPTSILQKLPQAYNNPNPNNNNTSPKKVVRFQDTESDIQIVDDTRSKYTLNKKEPVYNVPLPRKHQVDITRVYNAPLLSSAHVNKNNVYIAPVSINHHIPVTRVYNTTLPSTPHAPMSIVYNAPLPSKQPVNMTSAHRAPVPSAPHGNMNSVHCAPLPIAPPVNINSVHNTPLLKEALSAPHLDMTNQATKNQLAEHMRHKRITEAIEAAIASPANKLPLAYNSNKLPNTVTSNWSISQKLDHKTHEVMPLKLKLKKNTKAKDRSKRQNHCNKNTVCPLNCTGCKSHAIGAKKKANSKSNKKEISFLQLPEDGNYLIVRKIIEECPMCYMKLNIRKCAVNLKLLLYTYYCDCGLTIFHIPNTPDNIPHPIKIIET